MANKGLQFEHAVMYIAKANIVGDRSSEDEKDFNDASQQWPSIPQDIKTIAKKIVLDFSPPGLDQKQSYFKSFRKMSGGGEEPKTDILFIKSSKKYKCSMKWGKSFQLTSAGVEKSLQVFKKVLEKSMRECTGSGQMQGLGYVQSILEKVAEDFENATGTMDQPTAKRILSDAKKTGGLQEQFETVLGTRRAPNVSDIYYCFKRNLTHECMTGEMLFGGDDRAANYLFTESGIKPIDKKAVEEVMSLAGVRLALKGRGKDPTTGVRRNAIVIRYEV